MRSFMLSACALAALLGCPAHADGGAEEALSYTWTGLFAGINAGYGWQNSDWDFAPGGSTSPQDNSGVVGLQVGYGAQFGDNWYLGLEASLDASGIDGKSSCFSGETCETHVSSLGDVAARVGVASGRSLLYLKGGIAYEDATHHIESPGVDNHDNGGAVFGYLIGGGAEYALVYNITTKIEYDYMDFGSNDYTISPDTRISVKEPINLVKVGFNFKFD
jgi:outer membrane immunogenic protein